MLVAVEGLPSFLISCVGQQHTLLFRQYSRQEWRFIRTKGQGNPGDSVRRLGAQFFTERQHMGTAFRNQNPGAGVRNKFCERPQESVHDRIHTQVLG